MKHNGLFINFFKLSSSQLLSQILFFAMAPLLLRLYDPSAFGIMGFVLSVSSMVSVFVTLRYEMAIVVAQEHEIKPLCMTVILLAVGFCILGSVLLYFLYPFVSLFSADWLSAISLRKMIWVIPLLVFLQSIVAIFVKMNIRKNAYT
ncbi:oligosaccharide flippase family protein, partial [bacterium]|nr:oligosaccharide flippase family protein [bacterium]